MTRPSVRKCYGTNPKTGRGVGERHSWRDYGAGYKNWGKGRCHFCGRYLEDLLEKPAARPMTLDQAVRGS